MLMEFMLAFLCCGALVLTTAFGAGVTYALERFLGGWAYVVGAVLPVIAFAAFYTVYYIWIRATPCEPAGSLACGEPFFVALLLFVGVAFFVLIANILAQTSLYLYLYGSRQTIPAAVYDNVGEDTGEYVTAPAPADADQRELYAAAPAPTDAQESGPVAETPAGEQYVDESEFSGLPPDVPKDEPLSPT